MPNIISPDQICIYVWFAMLTTAFSYLFKVKLIYHCAHCAVPQWERSRFSSRDVVFVPYLIIPSLVSVRYYNDVTFFNLILSCRLLFPYISICIIKNCFDTFVKFMIIFQIMIWNQIVDNKLNLSSRNKFFAINLDVPFVLNNKLIIICF